MLASTLILVTGYNVYTSQQEVEMSDLVMVNIEALAGCEVYDSNHKPIVICEGDEGIADN